MRFAYKTLAIAGLITLSGCSTTQSVLSGAPSNSFSMTKACFAAHGGRSADMDARIEEDLRNHGVTVLTTPACDRDTPGVDMTVVYTDQWWWDVVMYLKTVDIQFYAAPGGQLIAAGHWANSPLHQFPSTDGVVANLVDDMFVHAGNGAIRTSSVTPAQ